MRIEPYLFFNGRCEEAFRYYGQTLGAEVQALLRFKNSPEQAQSPDGKPLAADKVMHACVTIGDSIVMASDSMTLDGFDALAKDGQVQMPFGETFFAKAFGAVQDKFGLSWMIIAGTKDQRK